MNEDQYNEMVNKAEIIEKAIAEDNFELFEVGMNIDCQFCNCYMRTITQYRVGTEHRCLDCPLWKERVCHERGDIETPFRVLDRYYIHFGAMSKDPVFKHGAIDAIRKLRAVIEELREQDFPERRTNATD